MTATRSVLRRRHCSSSSGSCCGSAAAASIIGFHAVSKMSSYELADQLQPDRVEIQDEPPSGREAGLWRRIRTARWLNTRRSRSTSSSCRATTRSEQQYNDGIVSASNDVATFAAAASVAAAAATDDHHLVGYLLSIGLHCANGLPAKDTSGTSDPYIRVFVGECELHRSATIFKSLSPEWNDTFQVMVDRIAEPLRFQVYDYDRFFLDDFIGETAVELNSFPLEEELNMTLQLMDKQHDVGELIVSVMLTPQTSAQRAHYLETAAIMRCGGDSAEKRKPKMVQEWSATVHVVVVEAHRKSPPRSSLKGMGVRRARSSSITSLNSLKSTSVRASSSISTETPSSDLPSIWSDWFVKLKMGTEKGRTKEPIERGDSAITWREAFDFRLYDSDSATQQLLQVSLHDRRAGRCLGRCSIDVAGLQRDFTHVSDHDLTIEEGAHCTLQLKLLITVTGEHSRNAATNAIASGMTSPDAVYRYRVWRALSSEMSNVGELSVRVYRATDLTAADFNGRSDPFCILQLVNSRRQTHTEYKTLNPTWNKTFTFVVPDIHAVLEVTVLDEDANGRVDFLGRLSLPLLGLPLDEPRWYRLKNDKLTAQVRGELLLEFGLVYNTLRAAIRTFTPREPNYTDRPASLKFHLLFAAYSEARGLLQVAEKYRTRVATLFRWERPIHSALAFTLFELFVYFVEIWHVPLILVLVLLYGYFHRSPPQRSSIYRRRSATSHDDETLDNGSLLNSAPAISRTEGPAAVRSGTILSKVQPLLLSLQSALVHVLELKERIYNTTNWSSSWLSTLAVTVLSLIAVLLYFVPLRYIIMAWGLNKFTKRLRLGDFVDNNEVLDFLSRVPSNAQIANHRVTSRVALPGDTTEPSGQIDAKS